MAAMEMERQELWKEASVLRADRDRVSRRAGEKEDADERALSSSSRAGSARRTLSFRAPIPPLFQVHAVLRAASGGLREAAELAPPSSYALDLPPSRLAAAGPAWSVSQPWAAAAEDLDRGAPAPKRSNSPSALAALENPALRLALARLLDGTAGIGVGSALSDDGPVLRPGSNPLPPAATLQALAGHSLLGAARAAAGAATLVAPPLARPSSEGLRLGPHGLVRGPSPGAASAAQAPLRSALEALLQAPGARAQGVDPSALQALAAEVLALQSQRDV